MDTHCITFRPVLRFSGSGDDSWSLNFRSRLLGIGNSRASFRSRKYTGILSHEFSDSRHMQYYASPSRCGGNRVEEKEERKEKKAVKKFKLTKRLSRDLKSFAARTDYSEEIGSGLMGEVKGKIISDATEVLVAELQHLRSEQKEQKRKRKEEKAQQKAALIKHKDMCDSGLSSSSSSS